MNKYRMLKKAGALQEAVDSLSHASSSLTSNTGNYNAYNEDGFVQTQQAVLNAPRRPNTVVGVQSLSAANPFEQMRADEYAAIQRLNQENESYDYASAHQTRVGIQALPNLRAAPAGQHDAPFANNAGGRNIAIDPHTGRHLPPAPKPNNTALSHRMEVEMGLFFHTIPEGQRVLLTDKNGRGELLDGPQRIWSWGRKTQVLSQYTAYPGEFLIVRKRDGSQEHIAGPVKVWFDPRIHANIEKEEALQIAAKEAIVVYASDLSGDINQVKRRIVTGPASFVPKPGEWLHTFSWHGSRGADYKKYPGALTFQKLWLMPDQMYHDVEDVRTADDVVLTIKLMLFFEMINVEKMLDETHDPIGDFINATSSDVIDLVGRYSFEDFKARTELLNQLESYSQLNDRAEQVGYRIRKIVYRGYSTTLALQAMHEQAIEARTRLKLERETENQAQELTDFKQKRDFERSTNARLQQRNQHQHDLELQQKREEHNLSIQQKQHQQQLQLLQEQHESERQQREQDTLQQQEAQRRQYEQHVAYIEKLKEAGVDLTAYLTQGRADQVIELRNQNDTLSPHIHVNSNTHS